MNNLPTEEMIDAARPLFLALEAGATSIEDVREQISRGGRTPIDHLPKWFQEGRGHLTKSGRAELAWHMMQFEEPLPVTFAVGTSDDLELRRMLCIAYAGSRFYGDDGELQDDREIPFIDFKRDSVAEIKRKISERGNNAWAEHLAGRNAGGTSE